MITKQDIIDYVMHTVWNPNPAVLKSLLDQLVGEGGGDVPSDEDFMDVTITCDYNVAKNSTIMNIAYCGISDDEFGIFTPVTKSMTGEAGADTSYIRVYCPMDKPSFIGLSTEILNQLTINNGSYTVVKDASGEPQGVIFTRFGDSLTISTSCTSRSI